MVQILVLFYSEDGNTAGMARQIARGVEEYPGANAVLRTVAPVSPCHEASLPSIPNAGPPYVTHDDLRHCNGLALGSPSHFGQIAAPLKYFIDTTSELWFNGALCGKPAGVFTSASSMHGGHEGTLLQMMTPLLHHGMLIVGLPYTEVALQRTTTGGAPYGATAYTAARNGILSDDESTLCRALGKRIAQIASSLATR